MKHPFRVWLQAEGLTPFSFATLNDLSLNTIYALLGAKCRLIPAATKEVLENTYNVDVEEMQQQLNTWLKWRAENELHQKAGKKAAPK